MTAKDVVNLLALRHSEDVFVPECKNGPSQGMSHLRLDAWAMKRSWANPLTFGYEIKLTRADFLQDDKWHQYLDYCAEFYFVTPAKLIQVEELPADVGLLWIATTGTRLYTKRKAARRDITIPEDLWRYVLMCRAKIASDAKAGDDTEKWRDWLASKRQKKDLGWEVGGRIGKLVAELQHERDEAVREAEKDLEIRARLTELGFDPSKPVSTWQVHGKLDELARVVPTSFARTVERVRDGLKTIVDELSRQEPEGGD